MDGQPIKTRSLQRELTRWVFFITLTVCALGGITTGLVAYFEAQETQDEVIFQIAQLISSADVTNSSHFDYYHEESTIVVQSLQDERGLFHIPPSRPDGFVSIESKGVEWRLYLITKADQQRFVVAQQTELINEIASASAMSAILPMFISAIILLVLIRWLVLSRLKPVVALAKIADRQDSANPGPLSTESIPTEIIPFVDAINRLLTRTKETIAAQNRFIANASHELRTPITALSLLAENLANARSQSEHSERMSLVLSSLERLNSLVNQLLNLARLQNRSADSGENVYLNEIVQQVVIALYPLAEQKNIDLGITNTTETTVRNINNGLNQLIENALANAIHYTPNNGKIDVEVRIVFNMAQLTIKDTGPGIDDEDMANIFTPFYRSKDNDQPGSGLGLAICAEIAEGHKGTITLENYKTGGLVFTYKQPVSMNGK